MFRFFVHVARTVTSLDITTALKVSIRGLDKHCAHPPLGRPRYTWLYVPWKQTCSQPYNLGLKSAWRYVHQDRARWKHLVEAATLSQGHARLVMMMMMMMITVKAIWQWVGSLRTGGYDSQISSSRGEVGAAKHNITWDDTSVPAKWHLIPSNGFSRVHECDRRHTDG